MLLSTKKISLFFFLHLVERSLRFLVKVRTCSKMDDDSHLAIASECESEYQLKMAGIIIMNVAAVRSNCSVAMTKV